MAKQNKSNQVNEREVNVAEALSKTELFFKENGKKISYIVAGIIVVVALFYAYRHFVVIPKYKEAQNQMFVAERNFKQDDFEIALKGDGNDMGFEQIIQKYGNRADNSVYFYAGVCELQLGNDDKAIEYLKKYKSTDIYTKAAANANIGDALVNKNQIKDAIPYFESAASEIKNFIAAKYLLKAAMCYEEIGDAKKAIELYTDIKDKYPQAPEGEDIDKYISRSQALLNK